MLPAGVETKTPSEINFLIIYFEPFFIDMDAACLLCLNIETSLIAKHFFVLFLLLTFISKGEIFIDSKPISSIKKLWQEKIGCVAQDVFITDNSLKSNIAFGLEKGKINYEKIDDILKKLKLDKFTKFNSEFQKNETYSLGDSGNKVSGGQRQRIGIARAIYLRPDVLVLDEATSALDNITERMVMEALKNLNKEMTIIIIAHRLNTIRQCDVIHILKDGKITDFGSYDFLNQNNDYFKEMTKNIN